MSKIYYNKLVRDRIQEIIEEKGETCEIRAITDEIEFGQELMKKIIEESRSLAHTRTEEEFLDEYADLIVVLNALTELLGFKQEDIDAAIEYNIAIKGKYANRHYLHWADDAEYSSKETPEGIQSQVQ